MRLFQDIADTRKISRNPGSNWRAIHAGSALVFGPCFAVASLWYAFVDWPMLLRPLAFLVFAILSFAYWRHLLLKARHISNVRRILYCEETR
jgi:hypothetical protein